jgi:hypothetical protein
VGRAHRRGRDAPAGRVTAGRPSRRQRLTLEGPNTPFDSFNPGRRSPNEWLMFNEVSWTRAPMSLTKSTATWTYSTGFLIEN